MTMVGQNYDCAGRRKIGHRTSVSFLYSRVFLFSFSSVSLYGLESFDVYEQNFYFSLRVEFLVFLYEYVYVIVLCALDVRLEFLSIYERVYV